MSDRLEEVLQVLDVGLQSSGEHGYGHDVPGWCARCQLDRPAPDGDLCAGCRAFLLGDVDEDPGSEAPSERGLQILGERGFEPVALRGLAVRFSVDVQAIRTAMVQLARTGATSEEFVSTLRRAVREAVRIAPVRPGRFR